MTKYQPLHLYCVALITLITTIPLQAAPLQLTDIYLALEKKQSLPQRTTLINRHGDALVDQAKSTYQLQVSAQSQRAIDHTGQLDLNSALTATIPIVSESQRDGAINTIKTQAQMNTIDETQRHLAYYKEVTSLYFQALAAQEAVRHTNTLIGLLNNQHQWLKKQVAIGKIKPSAATSTQFSTQSLQLQKAQYTRQKQAALIKLNLITGISTSAVLKSPNAPIPSPISDTQLQQRPDLHKQQVLIQNLKLQLQTLEWSFWPQVSVFGSITHDVTAKGLIGLTSQWRLLDGNERALTQTQLSTQYELKNLEFQSLLDHARAESSAYFDTLISLEKEARLAKSIANTAETQYRQYKEEYDQNLITFFEVLQTLNTWYDSQLDLSQRQIALQEAIALTPIIVLGQRP